MKTSICTFDMY